MAQQSCGRADQSASHPVGRGRRAPCFWPAIRSVQIAAHGARAAIQAENDPNATVKKVEQANRDELCRRDHASAGRPTCPNRAALAGTAIARRRADRPPQAPGLYLYRGRPPKPKAQRSLRGDAMPLTYNGVGDIETVLVEASDAALKRRLEGWLRNPVCGTVQELPNPPAGALRSSYDSAMLESCGR